MNLPSRVLQRRSGSSSSSQQQAPVGVAAIAFAVGWTEIKSMLIAVLRNTGPLNRIAAVDPFGPLGWLPGR